MQRIEFTLIFQVEMAVDSTASASLDSDSSTLQSEFRHWSWNHFSQRHTHVS